MNTEESVAKALYSEFEWVKEIVLSDSDTCSSDTVSEWSGYMSRTARMTGPAKEATNYTIGPLIDSPPTDTDTVLTAMLKAERVCEKPRKPAFTCRC